MVCSKECSVAVNSVAEELSAAREDQRHWAIHVLDIVEELIQTGQRVEVDPVLSLIPRQDCDRALVGQCDVHGRSI
jgi:hypothetical protein